MQRLLKKLCRCEAAEWIILMEILKKKNGTELTVKVSGRLDTNTSPQLETELETCLGDVKKLTFDFSDLEYISSAGLRIVLMMHKQMRKGGFTVRNVSPMVMEVFEITGFTDVLNIG